MTALRTALTRGGGNLGESGSVAWQFESKGLITIEAEDAEPEELATAVAAAVRGAPAVAFGDVVGANVTISLVALGAALVVFAVVRNLPFGAAFGP